MARVIVRSFSECSVLKVVLLIIIIMCESFMFVSVN